MKFAYLVCLVALLEVSTCQFTDETSSIEENETPLVETENAANETEPTEGTNTTEIAPSDSTTNSSEASTEPTTTDSDVTENVSYTQAPETETSSVAAQEETSTAATTGNPNSATLVHPTVLAAVLVPVCILLFSTKVV